MGEVYSLKRGTTVVQQYNPIRILIILVQMEQILFEGSIQVQLEMLILQTSTIQFS